MTAGENSVESIPGFFTHLLIMIQADKNAMTSGNPNFNTASCLSCMLIR